MNQSEHLPNASAHHEVMDLIHSNKVKQQENTDDSSTQTTNTQFMLQQIEILKKEKENMQLELDARPTLQQWKELKKVLAETEKNLAQAIVR